MNREDYIMTKEEYVSLGLYIWGEKFGVPNEDFVLTKIENKSDNSVVLYFLGNIKCTIINPIDMSFRPLKEKRLKVKSADKIIWEAWYYEVPPSPIVIEYTLLEKSRVHVIRKDKNKTRDEIIKVRGKKAISSF